MAHTSSQMISKKAHIRMKGLCSYRFFKKKKKHKTHKQNKSKDIVSAA